MFSIIHPAKMQPWRSAMRERNWRLFQRRCHRSFMSKKELWQFFPHLSLWQSSGYMVMKVFPPAQLGGPRGWMWLSAIKTFLPRVSEQCLLWHEPHFCWKCQGTLIHDTLCKTQRIKWKACLVHWNGTQPTFIRWKSLVLLKMKPFLWFWVSFSSYETNIQLWTFVCTKVM